MHNAQCTMNVCFIFFNFILVKILKVCYNISPIDLRKFYYD